MRLSFKHDADVSWMKVLCVCLGHLVVSQELSGIVAINTAMPCGIERLNLDSENISPMSKIAI